MTDRRPAGGVLLTNLPLDGLAIALVAESLTTMLLTSVGGAPGPLAALVALPGSALLGVVCRSATYLVRGRALTARRRVGTGLSLVVASLVAGAAFSGTTMLAWAPWRAPSSLQLPVLLGVGGAVAYAASALYYAIAGAVARAEVRVPDASRRALAASLHTREAELSALTARVNPHFLFNGLTSIAALTTRDPEGARRMCLDLATLLRDRLGDSHELVPLIEELRTVRLYLGIERVRFAERLRVEESIDEALWGVPVPKLILQPLVENAIKHGVARSDEGGVVRIEAALRGGSLSLGVRGPLGRRGERPARSGLGQQLVRGRLEALYAGRASAEFVAGEQDYLSTLLLPLEGPESS